MIDVDLITDLIRAGVAPELVGRVVNEITATMSRTNVPDKSGTTAREYERVRKREQRKLLKQEALLAGKQTMSGATVSQNVPDIVPDKAAERCDLTSLLTLASSPVEAAKQGSKTELVARRERGKRLDADWKLPDHDRQFARELGATDQRIDQLAAEFRDYWIAIPGQRGTKLDWSATWRNRVREVLGRQKGKGSPGFKWNGIEGVI